MIVKIKIVILILLAISVNAHATLQIVNAADFGLEQGKDAVLALRKALEACSKLGPTKVIIPKGKYDCLPDKATEKYLRISNNDNGMKRILFPLEGMKDFEFDGQGSEFIMHGQMVAFDVANCEHIKLTNFSIDWKKPFYFQANVVAVHPVTNSFDLKVFEECDYEIVAHELLFLEKAKKAIRTWKQWSIPLEDNYGWEQIIIEKL